MSLDAFKALVTRVESQPGYQRPAAFALGLASFSPAGEGVGAARILDTWFPVVNLEENFGTAAVLAELTGHRHGSATCYLSEEQLGAALTALAPFAGDGRKHVNLEALRAIHEALVDAEAPVAPGPAASRLVCATFIQDLAHKPGDAHDAYLRLHLLSQRKVRPHGLNLEGVAGLLNNVVWTSAGAFAPETFDAVRLRRRVRGLPLTVYGLDKFPRLLDYVLPSGVRIADASRVRLGAYLADGTVVTPSGSCSHDAGTLGKALVEGSLGTGVVVGGNADIGCGASIQSPSSGDGAHSIRIGEHCQLGAHCHLGISLGDHCCVEAGLCLAADTPVTLAPEGRVVKAAELSLRNGLLLRRNGLTGAIEAQGRQAC